MQFSPLMPLAAALFAGLFAPSLLAGEPASVREWRQANEHAIVSEFTELLSIPNVVGDQAAILRNAERIMAMMARRGLNPRLLEGASADVTPAVYGERVVPGATRTLLFYAHYDGQPVSPEDWASDPWVPVWRDGALADGASVVTLEPGRPIDQDWRLYARSASDDKAGVMAVLAAVEALDALGLAPTVNLKFFFEGEEEAGSPNLADMLDRHRDLLGADAWLFADGPMHVSGSAQIIYGARGDFNVDLAVYGPKRPLHSGHYGNWAPNPALSLSQLLASMKDGEGRVLIDGWFDDVEPLSESEKAAIAALPSYDEQIKRDLGLAVADQPGLALADAILQPSLNINGIRSADVGSLARNVIPTIANATLDVRLVKGNSVERQYERLLAHIRGQGFHVIDREPTDDERLRYARVVRVNLVPGGYGASRTPMDLPISQAVSAAVKSVAEGPVYEVPTVGGSLPLAIINETLGVPTIIVPVVNHDNNQHAENENLRIGNLWYGIEAMAALMRMR